MGVLDRYLRQTKIAYFSMEIALRPEVHTYSGGLGVLAGDTARSCADLEIPAIFITLITRAGYPRQEIDANGWQSERPNPWNPQDWAKPLGAKIAVPIEEREVWIRPWLYLVEGVGGYRTPVLLLDTDLEENDPADRRLTDELYGGDAAYRFKQEVVLGIGGLRMLRALGFDIQRYHLNEGHSALLSVDLLRRYQNMAGVQDGDSFDVARVRDSCIFTTHTPVEAGHDQFSYDLVRQVLDGLYDIDFLKQFAGAERLNMTRLALNLSGYVNGVAKRHAETSRKMFPGYRVHAVTNGVHAGMWTCSSFAHLYQAHFPDWRHDPEVLIRAEEVPDAEIWAARADAKRDLLHRIQAVSGVAMDPDVAVIGFARRMTGYKRANLLFQDIDRLLSVHAKHPFQVVMAGKAHPKDEEGKRLIQQIHEHARALSGRINIAFLPNYDMELARYIVSGPDIWLNNPVPPLEASGTSGMKAALNGVLNFSVPDGWWAEACVEGQTGWAIGTGAAGTSYADDAESLYGKLESTVLPLYYGDKARWAWMMKEAISRIGSYFNTHRMMRRYATEAYIR